MSFPLAVGTKATARRSERISRSDVQLVLLKPRGASWPEAESPNCRNEQESAWRSAISVLRGKLRHALLFFERTRRLARRDNCRFTHPQTIGIFGRRLTFAFSSLLIPCCAAVLKRRFGCGGLSTELVESCQIVTIYFLDVSAS
jgi:hypothetical protein